MNKKQRMMKTSMPGPRIRAEIDAMIPLSFEDRMAKMNKMSTLKLALMNDVMDRDKSGEIDLKEVTEAIVWEMPDGKFFIEIKGRR